MVDGSTRLSSSLCGVMPLSGLLVISKNVLTILAATTSTTEWRSCLRMPVRMAQLPATRITQFSVLYASVITRKTPCRAQPSARTTSAQPVMFGYLNLGAARCAAVRGPKRRFRLTMTNATTTVRLRLRLRHLALLRLHRLRLLRAQHVASSCILTGIYILMAIGITAALVDRLSVTESSRILSKGSSVLTVAIRSPTTGVATSSATVIRDRTPRTGTRGPPVPVRYAPVSVQRQR